MRFNFIAIMKPPKDPIVAKRFLLELPNMCPEIKVCGDISKLTNEECVVLAGQIWFQLSQIPIIDEVYSETEASA